MPDLNPAHSANPPALARRLAWLLCAIWLLAGSGEAGAVVAGGSQAFVAGQVLQITVLTDDERPLVLGKSGHLEYLDRTAHEKLIADRENEKDTS